MPGPVWRFDRSMQCPERGPGLTHIQDYREHPDGRCLYCGLGKERRQMVCAGAYCINMVWVDRELTGKFYCPHCQLRRGQTKFSHEVEGHSRGPIKNCPACEEEVVTG